MKPTNIPTYIRRIIGSDLPIERFWTRYSMFFLLFLASCQAKKAAKLGAKAVKKGVDPILVVLAVVLLLMFLGSMIGFFTILGEQKRSYSKRGVWFHVIGFALIFWGLGALAVAPQTHPQAFHWILVVGFLVLGTLHVWFMYLFHTWSKTDSFLAEFLFTGWVSTLGALGFVLLFYFLDKEGFNLIFDPSIIAFFIPFFVITCYYQWFRIPRKEMTGWTYPVNQRPNTSMIQDAVNRPHMMISIMIYEDLNHDYPLHLPLRAIPTFSFGGYFHAFLSEQIQHGQQIRHHVQDPTGAPVQWLFYIHDPDKWKKRRYINPDQDFRKNGIQAGDTIVALRIVRGEQVRNFPQFDLPTLQGPIQRRQSTPKPKIRIQKRN